MACTHYGRKGAQVSQHRKCGFPGTKEEVTSDRPAKKATPLKASWGPHGLQGHQAEHCLSPYPGLLCIRIHVANAGPWLGTQTQELLSQEGAAGPTHWPVEGETHQICSLILLPSSSMVLILKSIP